MGFLETIRDSMRGRMDAHSTVFAEDRFRGNNGMRKEGTPP